MRDLIEIIVVLVLLLVGGVCWWNAYVVPNDKHQFAVMECVEGAPDQTPRPVAWVRCHNRLIDQAGGLVPVLNPPTR